MLVNSATQPLPALMAVSNSVVRVLPEQHKVFQHYSVNRLSFSGLTMHRIESDPVTVYRRDEDILADHVFDLLLHVQIEGTARFIQADQSFTLERDAIAIVPVGIPYVVTYPEKGSKIILRIPHRVFQERVLCRESELGAAVFGGGGLVPVVINMLKALSIEPDDRMTEMEKFALADSFLAILGSVVRSRAVSSDDGTRKTASPRLSRILAYLDANFADHELTPARLAAANFVSVRHLHCLFQQAGSTVSKAIWEKRLTAGRNDLIDPAMAGQSISEIAYRRGFNDSAHFSRAFKARFGVSPRELRGATGSHAAG